MPKMNVNLYVIEDYENENALKPKKTNPIQTRFTEQLSNGRYDKSGKNIHSSRSVANATRRIESILWLGFLC